MLLGVHGQVLDALAEHVAQDRGIRRLHVGPHDDLRVVTHERFQTREARSHRFFRLAHAFAVTCFGLREPRLIARPQIASRWKRRGFQVHDEA
jgi:hypothetical protein